MTNGKAPENARGKLLDAAVTLIRKQGFAATHVDQLCATAGVTKGAFFHHFPSKEALGVATAAHWGAVTEALFKGADYHAKPERLERLLAYLDLREAMIRRDQILHLPRKHARTGGASVVSGDCARGRGGHQSTCADAGGGHRCGARQTGVQGVEPCGLAIHIQAALQGSFVLARRRGMRRWRERACGTSSAT
jgi:TetR/AcrR family transcriptional regulator, transcriptional repressor for nem operon